MPNAYANKVQVTRGGQTETLIDLTADTAIASDVAQGKYFHLATGERVQGTATGGGGGGVYQDQDGYIVLSDQGGGSSVTVEALSVTQNGTYTAPTGKAYSPVTVNVGGNVEPTPWVRPSEWPDLSQMDVSAGDILYMTSYADEARGFCAFSVGCTGSYTVEVGSISGSTFTADSTQSYANNAFCELYYGLPTGGYKVLRVTGTAITKLLFRANEPLTIDGHACYTNNQGIVDMVGKLPSCKSLSCSNQYNLVNARIVGFKPEGSCANMFSNCYSLASLDVSDWNMSGATHMSNMFNYCYSLTSLDVSDWDTSSVTYMGGMFFNCHSLTSLDVSSWDVSHVTNMQSIFSGCYSLASIDVSGWNLSSATNVGSMFQNCQSLTSLDVSSWDVSHATSMSYMFYSCSSLTSLDVSDWDTSSVTSMSSMFSNCYSLAFLDVSGFVTDSVTNMQNMFSSCTSLTSLDVSGFVTDSVTNMSNMFSGCYSITSLDVSGFVTGSVTSMGSMFSGCYSITSLDVSDWDTSSATNMQNMFSGCCSIASLDVSGFVTGKVTNVSNMFSSCYSITSLDVSGWDLSKVTTAGNAGSIFSNCHGLSGSLTLPSSMGMIGSSCFSNCRSLTEWHFLSATPPTLSSTNAFNNMTDYGGKKIYVPAASLSAYQTAANWSTYASYMVGE